MPALQPTILMVRGRAIVCCEFDLQAIGAPRPIVFVPQGLAPAVERDITIEVPKAMSYEHIQQAIMMHRSSLVHSVTATSLFTTEDRRRVTIRCAFQDPERTLTADIVDREVERVATSLKAIGISLNAS